MKRQLVDTMIEELSRHAEIEELVFYPAVRREVGDSESDVLEALEEHHVVKLVLRELDDLEPTDERFDAKVTVMMESVRHHVQEEEQTLFPEVHGARCVDLACGSSATSCGREGARVDSTAP